MSFDSKSKNFNDFLVRQKTQHLGRMAIRHLLLLGILVVAFGVLLTGGSRSGCWEQGFCGDEKVDFGEQCDFGYTGYCTGCVDCMWHENVCGDGYQCDEEQCDDGNVEDDDGCSSTCELEHDMILVPAGSFIMSDPYIEEHYLHPQHPVTLTHDFYMDRSEMTNRKYAYAMQWAYNHGLVEKIPNKIIDSESGVTLVEITDFTCELDFDNHTFKPKEGRDDYPMLEVSWYGAAAYCDWLGMMEGLAPLYDHTDWSCTVYGSEGYRLPTEAEWEYAAQYDDERSYPWGDEEPTCEHANFDSCLGHTDVVCNHPLGYSALGFCDLAGNVSEWVHDWWSDFTSAPKIDPIGPDFGDERVRHDFRWSGDLWDILCSQRFKGRPSNCYADRGFRGAKIGGSPKLVRKDSL